MRLGLGTAQFGLDYGLANGFNQVSKDTSYHIVNLAHYHGLRVYDTAINYGQSEGILGEILASNAKFSSSRIVTKLTPQDCKPEDYQDWVEKEVTASLTRLRTPVLDGLLIHGIEGFHTDNAKHFAKSLQTLKEKGLIKKLGISIYDPTELRIASDIMDLDLVQAPMNLVDRRLEMSGWLKKLQQKKIELHVRSVFLQGLLLMDEEKLPKQFGRWLSIWQKLSAFEKKFGVEKIVAALAYPLSFSCIDCIIVGANTPHQLQQIISASKQASWQSRVVEQLGDLMSFDRDLIDPFRW